MRAAAVSFALAAIAACVVAPVPAPAPDRAASLAVSADAFAALERSATIDGEPVRAYTAGATATLVVVFASWCSHCRDELAMIDQLRLAHPGVRTIGVNYRAHEEYDGLGDAAAVRAYTRANAPWLIVVPIDETVFRLLGAPPKVPTVYIYDRAGRLADLFDRRTRALPTAADLDAALARLGA